MDLTPSAYDAFRELAKAVKPDEVIKPTRYWVAVLFQDRNPSEATEQSDFLWIKGNGKTTIEAIHKVYRTRYENEPDDFELRLGPIVTKKTDKLADLNKYEDKIVVLIPVRPSSASAAWAPADVTSTPAVGQVKAEPRTTATPPPLPHSPPVSARTQSVQATTSATPLASTGSHQRPTASAPPASARTERLQHTIAATTPPTLTGSRQRPAASAPPLTNAGYILPAYRSSHPPVSSASPATAANRHDWPPRPHVPSSSASANFGVPWTPPVPQQQPQPNHPSPYATFSSAEAYRATQNHQHLRSQYSSAGPAGCVNYLSLLGQPAQNATSPFHFAHPQLPALNPSVSPSPSPTLSGSVISQQEDHDHPNPSDDVDAAPQNPFLQQLSSETNPETLEKGVEKAMELVEMLQTSMDSGQARSRDAAQWLQQIADLKKEAVRSRTVIGVVGNTGAGKSSVINALLDEERLVPTNCMRACTAVVTELSWNDSNDEGKRYRADVEFISPDDWYKELKTLFDDILDGGGNISKEATSNPDSEAGIALAKIRAVYPSRTRDQLASGGLEGLKRDAKVNNILGTVKHIADSENSNFYKKLQTYPLIKVVKIYTKAQALSTGAVLVDLPGVHDSNAARAAVADGYMKKCTGLWIVAPITRAVDDKAAKSLLGDSFKRQLKLDGTYGNVTFICSKTDDISNQEAVQSLDLSETAEESWQEADRLRNQVKALKDQLKEHADAKETYLGVIDECDDQLETWEKLKDDLQDGTTVYAPTKKRKRSSAKSRPQKRQRRTTGSDDDSADEVSDASEASDAEVDSEDDREDRLPLTSEEIDSKVQELRSQKRNAKAERESIDAQQKALRREIKALNERIAAIDHEINSLCIKGRNDYSRGAIQQDFAAGIKELDQETAQEEDEENFDPDKEIRDYDEVARSLPVFCISARAFQKLSGRFKRDKDVSGFSNVDETELPQLQAHCKKLTESGRAAAGRRYLNNVSQLLNSLSMWASNTRTTSQLTASQRQKEAQFLQTKLREADHELCRVVNETLSGLSEALTENIYDKYDRAIANASDASISTAEGWGKPRNQGGLHFGTYRATTRRNGVFSGASGPRDFNGELAEPMIKQIATGWERAFQRALPAQLDKFKTNTLEVLTKFHNTVTKRASDLGVSPAIVAGLSRQLNNTQPFLTAQIEAIKTMMTEAQREVNREFTPVIAAAMEHAYELCNGERGGGCYMRMKGHMSSHVSQNRTTMFQDACDAVRDRLTQLTGVIKQELAKRAHTVHSNAQRDYVMVLGNIGTVEAPPPGELKLKSEVADILERGEEDFRRLVEGVEEDAGDGPDQDVALDSQPVKIEMDDTSQAMQEQTEAASTARVPESENQVYEDRVNESPSRGLNTPAHRNTNDVLTRTGSEEKENSEIRSHKAGTQTLSSNTATAETAVLQSLSDNI
ncbi:hypothetical protein BFW01_g7723 [Lasiodiplodia theobromae]|nr:hypothetical protein BFW01_g7723 [Lasiodiplodia theobromae]